MEPRYRYTAKHFVRGLTSRGRSGAKSVAKLYEGSPHMAPSLSNRRNKVTSTNSALYPPETHEEDDGDDDAFCPPVPYPAIRPGRFMGKSTRDILARVSSMLSACIEGHPPCKQNAEAVKLPTRVICIGEAPNDIKLMETNGITGSYVTLSYCWGGKGAKAKTTKSNLLARCEGPIPQHELSQTHLDAIEITKALGYQYLWIDAICIIQDDDEDWAGESANMGTIYRDSALTIAAAQSPDADGGILLDRPNLLTKVYGMKITSTHPNGDETTHDVLCRSPVLDHKKWSNGFGKQAHKIKPEILTDLALEDRAWCLQERVLSTRIVHFARDEFFWECHAVKYCECEQIMYNSGHGRGTPTIRDDFQEIMEPNVDRAARGELWMRIVLESARRQISFQKDRLPVLSGMVKELQRAGFGEYHAGLWRENLPMQLLWNADDPLAARRYGAAPSWSFASVEGSALSFGFEDDEFAEAKEVVQLDGVVCELASSDPTGNVKRGTLSLMGRVVPGVLSWNPELTGAEAYGRPFGAADVIKRQTWLSLHVDVADGEGQLESLFKPDFRLLDPNFDDKMSLPDCGKADEPSGSAHRRTRHCGCWPLFSKHNKREGKIANTDGSGKKDVTSGVTCNVGIVPVCLIRPQTFKRLLDRLEPPNRVLSPPYVAFWTSSTPQSLASLQELDRILRRNSQLSVLGRLATGDADNENPERLKKPDWFRKLVVSTSDFDIGPLQQVGEERMDTRVTGMILQVLTIAKRPLTIEELEMAVSSLEGSEGTRRIIMQDLAQVIKRDSQGALEFIDPNAMGFLRNILPDNQEAHEVVATSCMEAILSATNGDIRPSFFNYAAVNWGSHFRSSGCSASGKNLKQAMKLCIKPGRWFPMCCTASNLPMQCLRGLTGPMVAAYLGLNRVTETLLKVTDESVNAQDDRGATALHYAVRNGHRSTATILVSFGANLKIQDCDGRVPLHIASSHGHTDTVQLLLQQLMSTDINCQDHTGATPLHYAVQKGHRSVLKALLSAHADVNVRDNENRTPLHHAVLRGEVEFLEPLLQSDLDLDIADKDGNTPFKLAENSSNGTPGSAERNTWTAVFELLEMAEFSKLKLKSELDDDTMEVDKLYHFEETILAPEGSDLPAGILEVRRRTVYDYLRSEGVDARSEIKKAATWLHIPANNMTWLEVLMHRWNYGSSVNTKDQQVIIQVNECVRSCLDPSRHLNKFINIMEIYENELGRIADQEATLFKVFCQDITDMNDGTPREKAIDMVSFAPEMGLLREVKDIRDELHTMTTLFQEQLKVIEDMRLGGKHRAASKSAYSFVRGLSGEAQGMDKRAETTAVDLNALIDLKQKFSNILEARWARNMAEESSRQGTTLMVFTAVTIVFLPLSFMAAIFSVEIAQFPRTEDGMELSFVMQYICESIPLIT
ncbi:hypothetical protein OQA88_5146 [Cercophora sp. LCS_1]